MNEINLEVKDLDKVLCRLVYSLRNKVSKEERLYLEIYKRSEGGFYDRRLDANLMTLMNLSRSGYLNNLISLEKKGLLIRGDGVLVLNKNLVKKDLYKLIISKRDENK